VWITLLQMLDTHLHAQLGLTTMYNFWAYPENVRLRLSQILVLPPYQEAGLGKRMLQVGGCTHMFVYTHVCVRKHLHVRLYV